MVDIVIDFGGTNIKAGLAKEGRIVSKTAFPACSDQAFETRLEEVRQQVELLLEKQGLELRDCRGFAAAMPGIVNASAGKVLSINAKYESALAFDFAHWAATEFGMPLLLENDARAALAGEWLYGAAKGETDVVLAIFGTGIGSAALIDGKLLRGRHHQAGILGGHMTTDAHGRMCTCGNRGCVEALASHSALRSIASVRPGFQESALSKAEGIHYQSIIQAAGAGDRFAADLLDELIVQWCAGIVNLVHAYDPSVVVLSGGLMKSADVLLPRIADGVNRYAWTPWGKLRFAVAQDPDSSVLLGLSGLLRQTRQQDGGGDDDA